MAPKQKTRKTSSGTRKKKTNGKNQKSIRENGVVQDEIILVIALVLSILLFLSNFDLSGKAGLAVSSFVFGMVGVEAYLLPFILFFMTAFHISNLGNRRAGRKLLSASVFFVALSGVIELIAHSYSQETKFVEYFTNSMNTRSGGGLIGGILVMIFCSLFEEVATYIILIAVMLISVIVITGKAIFTYIARKSKSSISQRKEYQKLRMEQQEELEANSASEVQGRRPPKTFLLNQGDVAAKGKKGGKIAVNDEEEASGKDSLIPFKERKLKKGSEKDVDELPVLNFHGLFDEDAKSAENETLPLYEEELRNKFGQSGQEHAEAAVEASAEIFEAMPEATPDTRPEVVPETSDTTSVVHDDIKKEEKQKGTNSNSTDIESLDIDQHSQQKEYVFPPLNLLSMPKPKSGKSGNTETGVRETAMKLQSTLESFGVHVAITNVSCGPAVTRYELQPEQGVKVSRITALADDIKLNLAAADIRIEAPIPGKAAVGIEVPNKENSMVAFRELIESKEFTGHPSDIAFAVGKDIGGQTVITDIGKMPHLMIAGATGSGKSVCINTLIMSILYKAKPSDVRLIMVDPKVVELNVYNGIPHLLIPVVTDPKKASAALNWAVMEMTERYKKFADVGVRDLKGYNEKAAEVAHLKDESCQKLPQIVIIIDELADLMMVAPGEVEDAICRLAQMARAAGLHLIIATQRPSVNVITGLIKANIPSRVAFAVSSAIDSRTILDGSGAEKLLGKGDMLFFPSGYPKPVRIQGAFVSDKEVSSVVEFLKKNNNEANYSDDIHDKINNAKIGDGASSAGADERDEYFAEAGKFIIEKDKASIGMLQRVYKIGFNRAARIMDQLFEAGVVGPEEGTKPRKILMSEEEFEQYLEEY